MGRSRDIAEMLSKTELSNTGNEHLITEFSGVDSAYVTTNTSPALSFLNTLDSLPVTSLVAGQQAYVSANNRLYISDGSGWYNKALITLTPTMTLDPTGVITLSSDGVTTSTVTVVATDSDTPADGLTYSVDSDGNGIGKYVISQDSSVFTIRPLSADSGATTGTFTLTFSTTDGDNIATDSADFSLTFANIIDSSSSTVLLMKAAGNSATNAAITYQNSSDVSTGFTEAGDPQAGTFSPYRSGGYSAYFDGTGDYITTSTSTDFAFGTGDFTWEMWIYHTVYEPAYLLEFGTGGNLGIHHATAQGHLTYYTSTTGTGSTLYTTGFGSMSVGQWYHIAAVRDNGTTYLYTDGVLQTSASDTTDYGSSAISCRIGAYGTDGTYGFTGYIRDVRILKGTVQYTSAFTPPTEALTAITNTSLLACHLPYFADGSTNSHTLTPSGNAKTTPFGPYDYLPWDADDVGGAVHFDGNDYITSGTLTAPGTGDFTYEAWVRLPDTNTGTNQTIFDTSSDGFATGGIIMHVGSDRRFSAIYDDGGLGAFLVGTTDIYFDNVWHHVAAVRNNGSLSFYVDGVVRGGPLSYTISGTNTSIRLGATNATTPANYFTGEIANFRATNSAVYTAAFTPPTAPVGNITNTQLLMNNKSDTNIYDAAAGNTFSLLADAQSSTSQRKFTTSSSVYFDGTGDYIEMPDAQDLLTLGTGDFTIECWFRPSVVNINTAIMDFRPDSTTGSYPFIQPHNTNLKFQNVSSGTLTASGVLSANTWIHIAVVRSNGTTTLYTDGTSRDSGVDTTDYAIRSVPNIGKHNYAGSNLNGYLQDLRISKGFARYTAAFTPPTAEFEL